MEVIELKPGDILHVTLGGDLGDDAPFYVPTVNDFEEAQQRWERAVPDGVKVIVTHALEQITVFKAWERLHFKWRSDINVTTDNCVSPFRAISQTSEDGCDIEGFKCTRVFEDEMESALAADDDWTQE